MYRRLDHAEESERSTMRPYFELGLCVFAMTISTLASAEELGRLFFTPEQRNQLDYAYNQDLPSENPNNVLMLNGIVQQHGGKRTAWINGVPQAVGRSDERSPESIKLKVGQRVLLNPAASPDTTSTQNQDASQQ
jgi:hypothetical protein